MTKPYFDTYTSRLKQNRSWLFAVLSIFLATRLIYYIAGVRFDISPLTYSWQIMDIPLLKNDLLRSVYYLHSQPPLFNLALGIVIKLEPLSWATLIHLFYLLLGLLFSLSFFLLMVSLGISALLSLALVTLFLLSPASILYENWLFYTYPVMVLLVLSAVFLHRYASHKNTADLVLFFLLIACIAYLRSLFHLVWVAAVLIMPALVFKQEWKRIVLIALVPFLLVFGLYLKNAFVFGKFTSSTWVGMGISKLITFSLPDEEREHLIKQGKLSPLAMIPPFYPLESYKPFIPPIKKTGIPILDLEESHDGNHANFNNIAYITISGIYMKDACYVLFHIPRAYLKGIMRSLTFYVIPAHDYWYLEKNRQHIRGWDSIYKKIVFGQFLTPVWKKDETKDFGYHVRKLLMTGVFLIIGIPFLFVYGIIETARAWRENGNNRATGVTLLYLSGTVVYLSVVGNLMELGENYRFRFLIDPFYIVFLGLFIEGTLCSIKARKKSIFGVKP